MNMNANTDSNAEVPDPLHIYAGNDDDVRTWAQKLDVTEDQLRAAVQEVGSNASDVEAHLKGSRSTTNSELEQAVDQLPANSDGTPGV
jgi:Protein of unknown function (DUF3606)